MSHCSGLSAAGVLTLCRDLQVRDVKGRCEQRTELRCTATTYPHADRCSSTSPVCARIAAWISMCIRSWPMAILFTPFCARLDKAL